MATEGRTEIDEATRRLLRRVAAGLGGAEDEEEAPLLAYFAAASQGAACRRRLQALELAVAGGTLHVIGPAHGAAHALMRAGPPPALLFASGTLPESGRPRIGIVGTRRASEAGLERARSMAAKAVAARVEVWSGGAAGIDTAAHEGCLNAGGRSVACLPSGFDRPYPRDNAALFERLRTGGGACLGLRPPWSPATRSSFHARNALLAACVDALVVVEAPIGSGALDAARAAIRAGTPLFTCPGQAGSERHAGSNALAEAGVTALQSEVMDSILLDDLTVGKLERVVGRARVRSHASARSAANSLESHAGSQRTIDGRGRHSPPYAALGCPRNAEAVPADLEGADAALWKALAESPADPVTLAWRAGSTGASLDPAHVAERLVLWSIEGRIARLPGGLFGVYTNASVEGR